MPLRCLLLAPYCATRFTDHDKHEHALAIKRGLTTVRSICSNDDADCPSSQYGNFIMEMGECRNVTEVFRTHYDILLGFLNPGTSDVASDVQWLLDLPIEV